MVTVCVVALGLGVWLWCTDLPAIPIISYRTADLAAPAEPDGNALFCVRVKGRYGYIRRNGRIAIAPQFEWASDFSEGRASVSVSGKFGFIDRTSKWVIQPQFSLVGGFVGGVAPAQSASGEWGYIGADGVWVIAPQFDAAFDFAADGRAIVGSLSLRGRLLARIDATPSDAWSYHWIDRTGKYVGSVPNWARPVPEPGGLAPQWGPGGLGFVDHAGVFVIAPHWAQGSGFAEGLAAVQVRGGLWGYIDPSGSMVIAPQFNWGMDFRNGLAEVVVDGKAGYIDREGKWVWEPSE